MLALLELEGMIIPITFEKACRFVNMHHRHHFNSHAHKWSIGYEEEGKLIGVGMIGRPLNRHLDDGLSLEITRVCVLENNPNVCSIIISALCRSAKSMGYKRVYTYTLESESGSSLKGCGFENMATTISKKWVRHRTIQTKLFTNKLDHLLENKIRWGRVL